MSRAKFIVNGITFKSVKECGDYVKQLLTETNDTMSVKETNIEAYNFLVELGKRHPRYNEKFIDFKDFKINRNSISNQFYELNIINNDDSITEISWRTCCSGKGRSDKEKFTMALRQCINTQISDFRKLSDLSQCKICNCSLKDKIINIDHHEPQFCELVHNFLELHNDKITAPKNYTKIKPSNQLIFSESDNWIGELFAEYHFNNATLRVTCKECNASRPKAIRLPK